MTQKILELTFVHLRVLGGLKDFSLCIYGEELPSLRILR
jgi:hypothetical protein